MNLSKQEKTKNDSGEPAQLLLLELEGKIVTKFFFKTNTLFLVTATGSVYTSDHRIISVNTSWDCVTPRVIQTVRMDTQMKSFERLCADIAQNNPCEDDHEKILKIVFKKKADKDKFGFDYDFLFCTLLKVKPPRLFIGFTKLQ